MPGVPARLRPFARPVREDAVQDVERLAHLLRVRVRAEVPDARPVPLAREHHARVLVLDRDRDVRERLVVAQADVERRPVPLDEVLLEVERLDLGAGDDHLDVRDPLRQQPDLRAAVLAVLEVRAHARAERLRLADVEDVAFRVAEQVDARASRAAVSAVLDAFSHRHGYRSRGDEGHDPALWRRLARRSSLAPAAHAGGPASCSARPRTPSARRRSPTRRRRWTSSSLAGFRAVRITQVWAPGERAVSRARTARCSRTSWPRRSSTTSPCSRAS